MWQTVAIWRRCSAETNPGCAQDVTASAVGAASQGCFWTQDMAGLVAGLPGVAVTYRRDALGSLVALLEAQRT
jgi:hypothetical protein